MKPPTFAPLRVDFAGGWLDVPAYAIPGAFVVNCAIQPLVSLENWGYERNAGLGGSAAWSVLSGQDAVASELKFTGWQDPAVILETGLCIWRSGQLPVLDYKGDPAWLQGRMALWYSGQPHNTADLLKLNRDYQGIAAASHVASAAVRERRLEGLAEAIRLTYQVQLGEGMRAVPAREGALAAKYAGSGHGGYVLYLFADSQGRDRFCAEAGARPIEPYVKAPGAG